MMFMKKYGNYSYDEFRTFPVGLRNHIYQELVKDQEAKAKSQNPHLNH